MALLSADRKKKPKTKPKPEWTKTSLRKKDTSKQTDTQSEYWKEARPDWTKGKSPLSKTNEETLKFLERSKPAKDEIWEEMRPDWAKGKSPVDKPKESFIKELEKKASSKKKDIWEDERPDWSKENSPVVEPSAKDIRNIEEKKKYGYPAPEWTSRVRSKHKVRRTLFSSAKFKYKIQREGASVLPLPLP